MRKGRWVKGGAVKLICFLMIYVLVGVIIVSGIHIYKWYMDNKSNDDIKNDLKDSVNVYTESVKTDNGEEKREVYEIDFKKLKKKNSDTVAWIKVNGTKIDYPVVKTTNNKYYLTYNFNKKYNVAGWIFMDYNNKLNGKDKNIIIYGHNMLDDSMFGTLLDTLKKKWCDNKDNRIITLTTEKKTMYFKVFSVYKVENEDYYIQTQFNNNKEFEKFVNVLKKRSIYNFKEKVSGKDTILTLSTCANNLKDRVVLHAKKIDK